jgi:hypothetical protein
MTIPENSEASFKVNRSKNTKKEASWTNPEGLY